MLVQLDIMKMKSIQIALSGSTSKVKEHKYKMLCWNNSMDLLGICSRNTANDLVSLGSYFDLMNQADKMRVSSSNTTRHRYSWVLHESHGSKHGEQALRMKRKLLHVHILASDTRTPLKTKINVNFTEPQINN